MNADDMKWINQCIDENKGGAVAGRGAQVLRLHEREDGRKRNPVDRPVGEVASEGARSLRQGGRREVIVAGRDAPGHSTLWRS
jgi:hypothetical protein